MTKRLVSFRKFEGLELLYFTLLVILFISFRLFFVLFFILARDSLGVKDERKEEQLVFFECTFIKLLILQKFFDLVQLLFLFTIVSISFIIIEIFLVKQLLDVCAAASD